MNQDSLKPSLFPRVTEARDDRILPLTRWVSLVIIFFLLAAFVILFFFPERTDTLFAWTIRPTMTAMMMGVGYVSGIYFFSRLFTASKWHWFRHGFLPITTFTWFMGLATLLHWDRFHHNHLSFFAWAGLYFLTPFLVPYIWYRNRDTDPETPEPGDVVVPPRLRQLLGMVGTVETALALFLFLLPSLAIQVWPWLLTPLTSRVVGGWFALHGVLGIVLSRERRWSAVRIMVQTQLITLALMLVAVVRAWPEFDRTNPITWIFILGTTFWLLVLATAHYALDAQRHRPDQRAHSLSS
jgi:hypothetical protein